MQHSRSRSLNTQPLLNGQHVVYVMSRDQRVKDNHALLAAQASALSAKLPVVVLFFVHRGIGVRAREHYRFMIDGLQQVERSLTEAGITFAIYSSESVEMVETINHWHPREVFLDFNPLRGPQKLHRHLAGILACRVSEVDTHNIVPFWMASDKEEFAAHTFRPKVHRLLEQWLVDPLSLQRHPYAPKTTPQNDWPAIEKLVNAQPACGIHVTAESGETAARKALQKFIIKRLGSYAIDRNNPALDGQSGLSHYLHFGQLSSLRVALECIDGMDEVPLLLRQAKLASFEGEPTRSDSINTLLEELIVRKELADNYCFYNPDYDNLNGARKWAKDSLEAHRDDIREFIYSRDEWEQARTHDEAWNAAQIEMLRTGKMHGYMRMYWAKKLLEWSASPEEAIATAIYLNDHYSIDGSDPNGYTGIMWSIAGIHDRPWFDRSVYGKIRYMNSGGLARKFDLKSYIEKWQQKIFN